MSKLDDIFLFLNADPKIKSDCSFILNYITNFISRNPNREKIAEYYNNMPSILDKLLGISGTRHSTVNLLDDDQTNFEDLDFLLHAFAYLEDGQHFRNIFQSVFHPPDYVPDYKLNATIISRSITSLINQKRIDYLLSLPLYSDLERGIEAQRLSLERGNVVLTIFEYFLMMILIAMKDFNSKCKVNLGKHNKNFENLKKNYTYTSIGKLTEKSKEFLYSLDATRSLCCNFYLILFNNFLKFFTRTKHSNYGGKFKFFVSAIEFIWLSDFFLVPSSNYSPADTYSFFFKSSHMNISPKIPNVLQLECLHNLILSLQHNLFSELNNRSTFSESSLLMQLQKPLFYFFKWCFNKFPEESSNSEVNLCDIAKIWHSFITPWMQLAPEWRTRAAGQGTIGKNFLYQSQMKFSSKTGLSESQPMDEMIRDFIYSNLLFYTELFNDYINSFASLNVLTKNELSLFNKVLELFNVSRDGEIVNGFVNLKILEDLALGKTFNYIPTKETEDHVKYIGSNRVNLFPFGSRENKKSAHNIVNNITMWVGKLESNQSNINDEVVHFLSTLKDSQETLKRLYDITEEETSELSYGYEDYDKIYLNRNYKKLLNEGNTWNRRIGHDELTVLYYFFRFLAGWIDYFKGIPVTYDLRGNKEPPKTDLRPLCNYINLISIGIILSVIYILLKVIIRLI